MQRSHTGVLRNLPDVVDPAHTALVVVDVQNDFVSSAGFIARFGLDVTDMLAEVIAESTVLPNFLALFGEFENIAVREGTWGAEFYDQLLPPGPDDRVVVKPCYDGFEDTNLDVTLRSLGIRTCMYAGFASNVCVEATARHGFVKGYYSVLLSDATGAATAEGHTACERVFKVFYGPVVRTDEVAAIWSSVSSPLAAATTSAGG